MTPSEFMFNELQWLPFRKRIQYHTCIMVYKSLTDMAPEYTTELFNKVSETHGRNLRSVDNDLLKSRILEHATMTDLSQSRVQRNGTRFL